MNTFAMNLVSPETPVPFTTPGGEIVYWLNPNGTVTVGGSWEGILLPGGVVDTGALGGLTSTGEIVLYRPDLDGYYNISGKELNPVTGMPFVAGESRSQLGPMDYIRALLDGYFTALERFAAQANASLPDASKININALKNVTLLTKTGPLAFVDAVMNYRSDGASGLAKFALGAVAGVIAGGIAAAAFAGAPALFVGGAAILAGIGAAVLTNAVWGAIDGHERFDQLTDWLNEQMQAAGDALQDFYNDAADWFGDKWDGLTEGLADFLDNLQQQLADLPGNISNFFDRLESGILDSLLNLSGNLADFFSLFGINTPGRLSDGINSLFDWIDRIANLPRDPLVFDLNGNGIETVGVNAGVLFDHNGDGIRHGTGWVAPTDGLLVWDRNGNGMIDSGQELFGDNHRIYIGTAEERNARDGFEALSHYDINGMGSLICRTIFSIS